MNAAALPLRLSVIIPVLNESATIGATLSTVQANVDPLDIIVVDAGSTDDTIARAARHGVRVISAPRGRGSQMHAGAMLAGGEALWFLHADTLPPEGAAGYIADALADDRVVGGNFEIHFAGDFTSARVLTWLYRRLAWIGLRYGDSAYFVRRSAYRAVGGFRPYPIFEDLDLVRRLRKQGRFVRVNGVVETSARRFQGRWFALVFARWMFMQVLYWLGASPFWLGRFYHHVRAPRAAWRKRATAQTTENRHVETAG